MEQIKEKLKSWTMWLSLASLVAYIVLKVAKVDISTEINTIMDLLLPILIGFGVVNNPNSRNSI